MQELTAAGNLRMDTRAGEKNESDLGTKQLDAHRMTKLMKMTPLRPPVRWLRWVVEGSPPRQGRKRLSEPRCARHVRGPPTWSTTGTLQSQGQVYVILALVA